MKHVIKYFPALSVLAVVIGLFWVQGYAAGYGSMGTDGEVHYIRKSIVAHMVKDFGRKDGEWGFGFFVPLAVIALFWVRRKELLSHEVRPALLSGGVVLCFGALIYFAGYRGEQKYFGYFSGQIMALGLILWFLGWAWFGRLFWLWALLGMMWPWRFLVEQVSAPLQLVMVKLTSAFLNLIGVDAVASGSSVSTASLDPVTSNPIALDVDVACSGMRSLFALVMIGLVFSFLRVNTEGKRWFLMALVPLVAVLGNFVRMLMLYFGSLAWGTKVAIGEKHEMSAFHLVAGLMVFVVALLLMSAVVAVLEGGWKNPFKKKAVVKKVIAQS